MRPSPPRSHIYPNSITWGGRVEMDLDDKDDYARFVGKTLAQ
jgi:hypothetical protein